MLKEHDDEPAGDIFGPRPPPGFASLRAPPSQVLLPLTVSNKCGQAFRWRGIKVWEQASSASTLDDIKPQPDVKPDASSLLSEDTKDANGSVKLEQTFDHGVSLSPPAWKEQTEWSLCVSDRVVLLRQDEERGFLYHRTLLPPSGSSLTIDQVDRDTEAWLTDYLNLDVPLEALYDEWAAKDKVFARFSHRFTGLRMLRQDPWECLCAFICSSNNNIARIGQMVQNLCTHFSPALLSHTYPACPIPASDEVERKVEGEVEATSTTIHFHPFPSPERLAEDGVEEKLRELGFGYRAKYIATTARMLCRRHRRSHDGVEDRRWNYGIKVEQFPETKPSNGMSAASPAAQCATSPQRRRRIRTSAVSPSPPTTEGKSSASPSHVGSDADVETDSPSPHSVRSYLQSLRQLDYHQARQELLQLPGIGPKVADCILLMSLDQPSSIPVDRHVFQFAEKWYSIRSKKYEDIAQRFRDLWGDYAGWAHSVLFTADLRSFATYNATKKEEKNPDEVAMGKAEEAAVSEEMLLQSVHSPPRVAIPELIPSASSASRSTKRKAALRGGSGRNGDQDEETREGTTLAERAKLRRRRR